ncbi:hypothetical protein A3Q56_02884 [Intoshia linei]|uniref:Uncharacterized protein n=1 Tax=Intoshia linei TaxID=1819745 RepID=A0A177B4X2_9BILA|nr:hypothetical protein A3Q56_02884 [Intoshia linei]
MVFQKLINYFKKNEKKNPYDNALILQGFMKHLRNSYYDYMEAYNIDPTFHRYPLLVLCAAHVNDKRKKFIRVIRRLQHKK